MGALAFVAGAAVIDTLVARGLDAQTGKTSPLRKEPAASEPPAKPKARTRGKATSIEPEHTAQGTAPTVG